MRTNYQDTVTGSCKYLKSGFWCGSECSSHCNITWIVTDQFPPSSLIKKQMDGDFELETLIVSFFHLSSSSHKWMHCFIVWYEAALVCQICCSTCSHSSQEVKSQWVLASRKLIYMENSFQWDCWANRQHQRSGLNRSRPADEDTHESEKWSLSGATPPSMAVQNKIQSPKENLMSVQSPSLAQVL